MIQRVRCRGRKRKVLRMWGISIRIRLEYTTRGGYWENLNYCDLITVFIFSNYIVKVFMAVAIVLPCNLCSFAVSGRVFIFCHELAKILPLNSPSFSLWHDFKMQTLSLTWLKESPKKLLWLPFKGVCIMK